MKTKHLMLIGLLFILAGCEKEPYHSFGFDSDFKNDSHGLVLMAVPASAQAVYLHGTLIVNSGNVSVQLYRPDGNQVFTETFGITTGIEINESFESEAGNWRLEYKSDNGSGLINLHITK